MLDYLRKTPAVRDVVVSGGDLANVPIAQLDHLMSAIMDIPNIKRHSLGYQRPDGNSAAFFGMKCCTTRTAREKNRANGRHRLALQHRTSTMRGR